MCNRQQHGHSDAVVAANFQWELAKVANLCEPLATVTLACYCNIEWGELTRLSELSMTSMESIVRRVPLHERCPSRADCHSHRGAQSSESSHKKITVKLRHSQAASPRHHVNTP